MDKFTEVMLSRTGLYGLIEKAERGPKAAAAIALIAPSI
jgi:fumarate hydratase, class I